VLTGHNDEGRSLTFGAFLPTRWLPGKELELAHSTWDGCRRKIDRHILPTLGTVPIRRLVNHGVRWFARPPIGRLSARGLHVRHGDVSRESGLGPRPGRGLVSR